MSWTENPCACIPYCMLKYVIWSLFLGTLHLFLTCFVHLSIPNKPLYKISIINQIKTIPWIYHAHTHDSHNYMSFLATINILWCS